MASVKIVDDDQGEAAADICDLIDREIYDESPSIVCIDCEGVNLSRQGTLEIISICFGSLPDTIFLVDFRNAIGSIREEKVRNLFESENVIKVIHDCRADCDALKHIHNISMKNVFDTSCFHAVKTGHVDKSLNDVLQGNSLSSNVHRDGSVYRTNYAFWATRPLTDSMIQWASCDVSLLSSLHERQLRDMSDTEQKRAYAKSQEYSTVVVDKDLEIVECKIHPAVFIGSRGANLRKIQKRTDTMIYQCCDSDDHQYKPFMVYYNSPRSLERVKRAMGHYRTAIRRLTTCIL